MSSGAAPHILMTADAVGGVWQYATDLAAALGQQGCAVTLAVLGPAPDADQRRLAEANGTRLVETGLPLDWLCADAAPVEHAAGEIARLARRIGADVLHCNMPTLAGAAQFPCPVVAVTHGCVATWWEAARRQPLGPEFAWHRELMRRSLLAADAVVAPSASFAATVQQTYALPERPLVVHNGRPPHRAPVTARAPTQAALTVGRLWDDVKNAALLDRVAARVSVPFRAAGAVRGPHGETAALEHLQALGQLPSEEINALLAEQPIFVSAATFEPFGLAVLEAASAGCALILSDIDTFRELWDGAAVFVAHNDEDGFAAAIDLLAKEPARREALGRAARERAQRFTPAATAAAMASIYAALARPREVAA